MVLCDQVFSSSSKAKGVRGTLKISAKREVVVTKTLEAGGRSFGLKKIRTVAIGEINDPH